MEASPQYHGLDITDDLQVIWTVLTFSISRCSSARQIYILRFFVGKCSIRTRFLRDLVLSHVHTNDKQVLQRDLSTQACNMLSVHGIERMSLRNALVFFILVARLQRCVLAI